MGTKITGQTLGIMETTGQTMGTKITTGLTLGTIGLTLDSLETGRQQEEMVEMLEDHFPVSVVSR